MPLNTLKTDRPASRMTNHTQHQANPKLALVIALSSTLLLIALQWFDHSRPDAPKVWMPDFTSYNDVQTKKRQFFEYLRPLIDAENDRITELREAIQSSHDNHFLRQQAKKYKLDKVLSRSDTTTEQLKKLLLLRVEIVPSSLALAQAAIESGWGTSRFAREGYNFFGHWCFSKGCGLVPSSRHENASHEVRRFSSPAESVKAYIHNLNTHASYKGLRALRREAKATGRPIHGCELATGLTAYSERGMHYVNEIRQLIRANQLSPHGNTPCTPIKIKQLAEKAPLKTQKETQPDSTLDPSSSEELTAVSAEDRS